MDSCDTGNSSLCVGSSLLTRYATSSADLNVPNVRVRLRFREMIGVLVHNIRHLKTCQMQILSVSFNRKKISSTKFRQNPLRRIRSSAWAQSVKNKRYSVLQQTRRKSPINSLVFLDTFVHPCKVSHCRVTPNTISGISKKSPAR
jgi:hypothetical protein